MDKIKEMWKKMTMVQKINTIIAIISLVIGIIFLIIFAIQANEFDNLSKEYLLDAQKTMEQINKY